MKKIFTLTSLVAALAGVVSGCTTGGASHDTTSAKEVSGSKLWAQNCARCHNSRSPASYSDAQWEVAMLHMRVRANLTDTEQKTILEFLQGGGQ